MNINPKRKNENLTRGAVPAISLHFPLKTSTGISRYIKENAQKLKTKFRHLQRSIRPLHVYEVRATLYQKQT